MRTPEYISNMIWERVNDELNKSGARLQTIGVSERGREIVAAHCGEDNGKQIIITAGIHARECYTALVVLEQIKYMLNRKVSGGAYFVPLVNPDGAEIFERGNVDWKANANGIDLNTNFDARWGTGAQNVHVAGAAGYIGEYPLCAKESRALHDFTLSVSPSMTVSYHCMGGELYWEFFQTGKARARDEKIAASIARHIGVRKVDGDLNSAGGYKDFCVESLHIPAVTIELLDSGNHPFSPHDFDGATRINKDLPEFILGILD